MGLAVPVSKVHWNPSYRLIHEHPPETEIFARIADPEDIDDLVALERYANARQKLEREHPEIYREASHVTGPGKAYVLATLAYPHPEGSRFSNGTWGIYYCAKERDTALLEVVYNRTKFLSATGHPPVSLKMITVLATLSGELHDLRGLENKFPPIYRKDDYSAAQKFGRELFELGSSGIAYDSVRNERGQCAAVFRPRVLNHARRERLFEFRWNGKKMDVFEMREYPGV